MAGRSNLENILLYGGGFLIVYYVLKSWGIIATTQAQTKSVSNLSSLSINNWKPLTNEQSNYIRSKI